MKGMFKGMLGAVVVAACAATPAYAADAAAAAAPAKPLNSQQQKMKDCNADAKTKALTGADRKTFMKTCLSGSAAATPAADAPAAPAAATSAKATQQQKMKDCNAQATAKTLKGADRKTFMSTCLKA